MGKFSFSYEDTMTILILNDFSYNDFTYNI